MQLCIFFSLAFDSISFNPEYERSISLVALIKHNNIFRYLDNFLWADIGNEGIWCYFFKLQSKITKRMREVIVVKISPWKPGLILDIHCFHEWKLFCLIVFKFACILPLLQIISSLFCLHLNEINNWNYHFKRSTSVVHHWQYILA